MPAEILDPDELTERVRSSVDSPDVSTVEELQGGTSSLTYWTVADGERVVVKVAPPGLEPTRNRDVLRQARVLQALTGTDVPVPRVLATDEGRPPEIPPFFVMTFEPGDCIEPNFLPPESRLPASEVAGRELDAARILGRLHAVDPDDIGLGDEPSTTLQAEVERWVSSFAACDEDLRVGSADVGEMLAASAPETGPTVINHGDYRVGNTLSEDDHVTSVIDWEIWGRGDPRVDLAWFLMMANPDPTLGRPTCEGMPRDEELLSAYQQARGETASDLDWFAALVRFKQAAAGALIQRNARRRGAAPPGVESTGENPLLTSARLLLGTG